MTLPKQDPRGGRAWLIQWHQEEVESCLLHGSTTLGPALGRHLNEVSDGDRVVMWVTGPKAEAGVWALGVVNGAVYEDDHQVDYGDPDSGRGLRPTAEVEVTHLLDLDIIERPTLMADGRFAHFTLFKRGGAQGANPWPLTDDQWQAIVERTPDWADIGRPFHPFTVRITLATPSSDEDLAIADLQDAFSNKCYDELSWDIRRVDGSTSSWECLLDPAPTEARHCSSRMTWQIEVQATTARRAFLQVFRDLRADPVGGVSRGRVLPIEPQVSQDA